MRQFLTSILLLLPTLGFTQIDKAVYKPYFDKADSVVKLYYGNSHFDKFIKLDSSKSEFLVLHNHFENRSKFSKPLNFQPNVFQFQYLFIHPNLLNDTFVISFLIDSFRQVMTGFNPTGLFDGSGYENFNFISKDSALKIAKRATIKKPLKNYEIELGWEDIEGDYKKYKQTYDIREIVKGRIVWRIKSEYRKVPEMDEKPYAEIFIIDALNGKLLSKEFPYIDWE